MNQFQRAGFIGLGVMGEPICRNLARGARCPCSAATPIPRRWRAWPPTA